MEIIFGGTARPDLNRVIADFVAERIPNLQGPFQNFTSMGVVQDGRLVAGVVYYDWSPATGTIEMASAATSKLWLQRPVLWAMFHYPFDEIGCQMAALRVSATNHQANGRGLPRLLKDYGFTETRIPRLYGRDEDGLIFTLTDDAWRSNGFHKEHANV